MKIAVCGCSFSAPVNKDEYRGTHWSEILAKDLDADLVSLARQGISNNAIRLQIVEAIDSRADLILINSTTPDRIEVPIDMIDDTTKTAPPAGRGYDKQRGLKNFNYNTGPYSMLSETIFSLIDWPRHPYRLKKPNPNIIEATKYYASIIYDQQWKIQCDNWMINSGLWDLHERKISFIYNHWIINHGENNHQMPEWFVDRYFVPESLNFKHLMHRYYALPGHDPGYHTTLEGQRVIAAEYLKIIKERM